ncbi:hypothetical protein CWI61_09015 [Neisseria meningitidis]|nr:hypothetical protein CWI61_09015 [Neisseria meningitidis]
MDGFVIPTNLHPVIPTNLHPVIPTKVGIQFFEFQSFPINCLSIECLDSGVRGDDGGNLVYVESRKAWTLISWRFSATFGVLIKLSAGIALKTSFGARD